ncbi:sporulation protein YpjB [Bacillus sp. 03113]|uniref:sporulation protein YpjB n=1 Tax=Bacillus sp. 03113 TaxID=2578211 RepID=UPI001144AB7F|nr:sporulation protein YpjB [Bacillus sp. 03113]
MKAGILIIAAVFFLLMPFSVYADHKSPIDELDLLSDEALQMVKLHRYKDARKILEYFSDQFPAASSHESVFSMDELSMITLTHDEAVEAMTNTALNDTERINRVTKFRLVMDAISSKNQPLWVEMKEPIMSDLEGVKKAIALSDNEDFHKSLNSFLSLYDVIHPSLKVDLPMDKIKNIDTKIQYIDQYRLQVLKEAASQKELYALETDLENIFDSSSEDEADPSLWWVIFTTGGIIISTLSYVGWKKYKGDREKKKNRSI